MLLPCLYQVAKACDFNIVGVRAGMFVRDAKTKCPDLEIVPYNFEAYEQVRIPNPLLAFSAGAGWYMAYQMQVLADLNVIISIYDA